MMGPSTSSAPIPISAMRPRAPSLVDSLSPEDKVYLPLFNQKRKNISLKEAFYGEFEEESIAPQKYMSSEQRELYRVKIVDGFFYDANNQLLTGPCLYTLFPDGRLYCAHMSLNINHSHLSSGCDLKGAGILYIEHGRLVTMSNDSGHYKPTFNEMREAIDWFEMQVNGEEYLFEDHSAQVKGAEINGIRYFRISPEKEHEAKITPIVNNQLVRVLNNIRDKALALARILYDKLYPPKPVEPKPVSFIDPGYMGAYYTSDDAHIEPVEIPDDINALMGMPYLLNLTCLQHLQYNSKLVSRFNCVLKSSK